MDADKMVMMMYRAMFGPCIDACSVLHATLLKSLPDPASLGITVDTPTSDNYSFLIHFVRPNADLGFDAVSVSVPPDQPRNKTAGPNKTYELMLVSGHNLTSNWKLRYDDNLKFSKIDDVVNEIVRLAHVQTGTASADELAYDSD